MTKSKRLIVFSEVEKCAFYGLPNFDDEERRKYFTFSDEEIVVMMSGHRIHLNVFCAIQIGYFKAKKMFFQIEWGDIEMKDVNFILGTYFTKQKLVMHKMSKYDHHIQHKNIAKLYNYKLWSDKFIPILSTHAKKILRCDISPNFIGRELIGFLQSSKIVSPGYSTLQTIIAQSLMNERKRINGILNNTLKLPDKTEIAKLIITEGTISKLAALKQDAKNFKFKMMLKERQKHETLKPVYNIAKNIMKELDISNQNIKYYSDLAIYYDAGQLRKLRDNQVYLYILCYVFSRYQEITDNLIEALKYISKKTDNDIRAKVKKKFLEEKAGIERKIGRLLLLYTNEKIDDV